MLNNEKEYEMEHQVKVVKISTALYSINHCQKRKYWSLICLLKLLYYKDLVKFCFCIYFTNQPFRLFCNSVGFQFEKPILFAKNQIWNFDVM